MIGQKFLRNQLFSNDCFQITKIVMYNLNHKNHYFVLLLRHNREPYLERNRYSTAYLRQVCFMHKHYSRLNKVQMSRKWVLHCCDPAYLRYNNTHKEQTETALSPCHTFCDTFPFIFKSSYLFLISSINYFYLNFI